MKSERQLSEELIKIILASSDYFVGIARGLKADGTVNVAHPQGYSVSAIAATPMTSSRTVTAFRVGSQWYAFGEINTVVNESVLLFRKSKPRGEKIYPVKTIFGIRNSEKLIFYLGGDRQSKEIIQLNKSETSVVFGYVNNFGKNKFYSYINYRNLPTNTFFVCINKNRLTQESQELLEDDWSKDVYRGIYLDSNNYPNYYKYNYQYYLEESRKVVFKENEVIIENTKLISKTNVNYPDGKLFREDLVLETASLNGAGEIVKTKLTSETSVMFATHYPFLRERYQSFESEDKEFETGFDVFQAKQEGGDNYTYSREINSSAVFNSETNTYTFTRTTSASISATYYRIGTYVEGGISWNLLSGSINESTYYFSFTTASNTTLPIGELPSANPSSDTKSIVSNSQGNVDFSLVYDDPFAYYAGFFLGIRDAEHIIFNFDDVYVENVYLTTYYHEAVRFMEKEKIENWIQSQEYSRTYQNTGIGTSTKTGSIVWDADFIDFQIEFNEIVFVDNRDDPSPSEQFFEDKTKIERYEPNITYLKPRYVPTKDDVKYTIEENNTIFSGANTVLIQDFIGELITKEAYKEEITTNRHSWNGQKRYTKIPLSLRKQEIKNIIKVKYDETEIEVNTGSFGLLDLTSNKVTVTGISPELEEGNTFTIVYTNSTLKYLVNINRVVFSGEGFSGDFVVAWETTVEGKKIPYIVKGTCSHVYNATAFTLTITCTVVSIKNNTPSSFPKKLIINSGSIFSYLLRKNINVYTYLYYNPLVIGNQPLIGILLSGVRNQEVFNDILSREILPFTPLSHVSQKLCNYYVPMYTPYCGYIDFQKLYESDSLVRNKFYSVVKTEKNKAWIEQWDIKDNGDVKYNKVFQVDYVPLKKPNEENNETLTVFAHSYHP